MVSSRIRRRVRFGVVASLVAVLAAQLLTQAQASAVLTMNQGGFATRYLQDGTFQLYEIQTRLGAPSRLYHYWSFDGVNFGSEILDGGLPDGERGYAAAINYGNSIQIFYKSGGALIRKYYDGNWHTETVVGSGVASSPATTVQGSVLHVSYVSTAGSLRHYWTSGAGWSSETVLNVSSICTWDRVPVMGTFGSQLHILARCLGNWLHFWQDPGGPWANEYLGVSATPADAEIALATTGDEFIVAGNATDGTLWRWWYTSGVGWREERVANQAAVGRIQVGYFFGSLHVAWSSGAAHNSWINGSSWSDESHICTSSCNDLDSIAVGSTYYILTPSRMLGRWNGSWTWFA